MAHPQLVERQNINDPDIIDALERGPAQHVVNAITSNVFGVNNAAVSNYRDMGTGWTPLLVAIYSGAFDVVDALLDHDASVRVLTGSREGALHVLFRGMQLRGEGRKRYQHHHTTTTTHNTPDSSKSTSWHNCMERLLTLEQELSNVQNGHGFTPMSLACHFGLVGGILSLYQLSSGIASMATVDVSGRCPMFHLLQGVGTTNEKCDALNELRSMIQMNPEMEALVACRIQPSSSSSTSSTSSTSSNSSSSPSTPSPLIKRTTTTNTAVRSSIVSDEHPLSFLNDGVGDTLLHVAVSMKFPDATLIETLLKHSGIGSSSLLHLADIKSHTVVDLVRMRAAAVSNSMTPIISYCSPEDIATIERMSGSVGSSSLNSSSLKDLVMDCLSVIETHLKRQEIVSQQVGAALIEEEEAQELNARRTTTNGGVEMEKTKQKRRKRRSKRARRRQRQKDEESLEQDQLLGESINSGWGGAHDGEDDSDLMELSGISSVLVGREEENMENSAMLLDLLMAGNIAPSRPFFPNSKDSGGGWLSVGPHGGHHYQPQLHQSLHQSQSHQSQSQHQQQSSQHQQQSSQHQQQSSQHQQQNHHHHHHHHHHHGNVVSPMFDPNGSSSSSSRTHHSPLSTNGSINGSMSSLDVSASSSPGSSQLSTSPPGSPGFMLTGRATSNSGGDWASVASPIKPREHKVSDRPNKPKKSLEIPPEEKSRSLLLSSTGDKVGDSGGDRGGGGGGGGKSDGSAGGSDGSSGSGNGSSSSSSSSSGGKRTSSLSIDRSKETIKRNNEELTKDEVDAKEAEAQLRLVELFPLTNAVDVRPSHLVPVRMEDMEKYAVECSAAQLDLMEKIHRAALDQIISIRLERTRQNTMDEIAEMLQRGLPITRRVVN